MSERRKSSWIVWASVVLLAALIAYPLSLGPMVFVLVKLRQVLSEPAFEIVNDSATLFYSPLAEGLQMLPDPGPDLYQWYGAWWANLANP